MSAPLVTIGLTTFNAVDCVESAVASALSQTWRPIEIVVVDDCSEDETVSLLERLANKHREIRIYRNEKNQGVAVSRNRIISEAKGEFVVFFDDDDRSAPDRVSKQIKRITKYEQKYAQGAPVICHTARNVIYPDGSERIEPTMGQQLDCRAPAGEAVARRILAGIPLENGYGACPTCTQMARLSTYRYLEGFDPGMRRSEDTELNIRLALVGGHFVGLEEPLVEQRMTKTSEKSLAEEYRNIMYLIEKHKSFLQSIGLYKFARRWSEAKHAFLEKHYLKFSLSMLMLVSSQPVHTLRRLSAALPHFNINQRFSRFHKG